MEGRGEKSKREGRRQTEKQEDKAGKGGGQKAERKKVEGKEGRVEGKEEHGSEGKKHGVWERGDRTEGEDRGGVQKLGSGGTHAALSANDLERGRATDTRAAREAAPRS